VTKKNIMAIMMIVLTILSNSTYLNIVTAEEYKDIDTLKVEAVQKFSDIKADSWFLKNVAVLIGKKIVNGYDDGTFKPGEQVTKAQFIKMVVTSLGNIDLMPAEDYWARTYIQKAQDLELLNKTDEKTRENYESLMSREDMAVIISKVIVNEGFDENLEKSYASDIKDYESMDSDHKGYVLKAYSKGIITGYEDGEFKPKNGLTRAEAATVIVRMLDQDARAVILKK